MQRKPLYFDSVGRANCRQDYVKTEPKRQCSRSNAAGLPKDSDVKTSSPVARHKLPRYAAVKTALPLLPERWYFA